MTNHQANTFDVCFVVFSVDLKFQFSEATQLQRLREKEAVLEREKEMLERRLAEEGEQLRRLQDHDEQDSPSHLLTEAEQG